MALRIRLARAGRKKEAHFFVVVMDSQRKRDGKFVEKIGHYHPTIASDNPARVVIQEDRCQHWIACGALPTDAVLHLMQRVNIAVPDKLALQMKKGNPDHHGLSKKAVAALQEKQATDLAERQKANTAKKSSAEEAS